MALFSKLFGPPEIELRTFNPDDDSILFSTPKNLSVGEHDAQAKVGDHKMRCRVKVESLQAGLHYGQFLEPKAAREHLAVLLPKPLIHREERRSAKRIKRGLRVNSPRIPRFVAITSDFSASGCKLKTEGPMGVGDQFDAEIEFDDASLSRMDILCKVVWCRREGEQHLVGVAFENLSKAAASRISLFVQDISRVEPGVVTGIYEFY